MKKAKSASVLVSLVILALGVILVIKPGSTLNFICRIVGIAFLLAAAVGAVFALGAGAGDRRSRTLFILGAAIAAIAGIILLANPRFVISLLPIAVGLGVIANGAVNLSQAISISRSGRHGGIHIVLAVATIVLGILIFANPFSTIELLVRIMGIILIYDGVSNIVTAANL